MAAPARIDEEMQKRWIDRMGNPPLKVGALLQRSDPQMTGQRFSVSPVQKICEIWSTMAFHKNRIVLQTFVIV
ncbi:hypothetical protein [Novosphingobium sp. SG919]|uniref:hypothetical protein n=2 Tax=unclassified Novosphingobium TaxID=2644732 RepID=UPI00146B917F|nr:hypothetical protein [Novosphingobium sp. SG919]NMN87468.1 hypothetical protein [Novosphingobium sp. SG916]